MPTILSINTLVIRDLSNCQLTRIGCDYFANGGFSDVWRAELVDPDTGEVTEVAVKVIKPINDTTRKRIFREARVWGEVEHEHIAPFFGISFDFDRPETPCLVTPFFPNGNISSYLKAHPSSLDRKLLLISQVAEALSYLHGRGIVHGDIKGTNVLINNDGKACLIDFGLSRIVDTRGFTTKTPVSSQRYAAPELYELNALEEQTPLEERGELGIPRFTYKSDVWAFALLVVEVLTGRLPFFHLRFDPQVVVYVSQGHNPIRIDCPSDIWDKLVECWNREPAKRPTMTELSQFFNSGS